MKKRIIATSAVLIAASLGLWNSREEVSFRAEPPLAKRARPGTPPVPREEGTVPRPEKNGEVSSRALPAAGEGNPFGVADPTVMKQFVEIALRSDLQTLPRSEMLEFFREWGFTLREESEESAETGQRLVARETAPHGGVFNLSIQHARDDRGLEIFEGLRWSVAPEGGTFASLVESWEQRAPSTWKQKVKSGDLVVWQRGDGYDLWIKQYSDENPSPRPGLRNAVRVGLEMSPD